MTVSAAGTSAHTAPHPVSRLVGGIHRWFIGLLLLIDLAAALWPGPGQSWRDPLGKLPGLDLDVGMPNLLLAAMLFNAGLALRPEHWHQVGRRPLLLLITTCACWLIPGLLLVTIIQPLHYLLATPAQADLWLGLVIVAAMPAAQSSTAWAQHARGNVLLCLAIVLGTNLVCPVVIPAFVRALTDSPATVGLDWDRVFSSRLLLVWVIVPSLCGWSVGSLLNRRTLERAAPYLALASAVMLLTLNYINAATALPKLRAGLQPGTLPLTLISALILCGGCYLFALWGAKRAHLPPAERTAVALALGMKNNGVALMTMTGSALGELPLVGLVLICYIVLQHLLAGLFSRRQVLNA